MNRQEFSAMVKEARERKGISKYSVCNSCRFRHHQILYIEEAKGSYSINNLLLYLSMIEVNLVISKNNKKIQIIDDSKKIPSFIEKSMGGLSRYVVCKNAGVSQTGLKLILNGTNSISIDTFLKLVDYFGYTLSIVDKPCEKKE